MTTFSIIVPSYNQDKFIKETIENLSQLKSAGNEMGIDIQVIVVDNCSDPATMSIIQSCRSNIDILVVEKDKGQYDAINKGLKLITGEYWTWLNTDDLIDIEGFRKLASTLKDMPQIDYIYGNVTYMDEHSQVHKISSSGDLDLKKLTHSDASISQPGSFFRTAFTRKIGDLAPFHFAFDYEYILRCLKNKAVVHHLATNVAFFRYYSASKSGSQDFRFLQEQLAITKIYGGTFLSKLGLLLRLRILKRRLLN